MIIAIGDGFCVPEQGRFGRVSACLFQTKKKVCCGIYDEAKGPPRLLSVVSARAKKSLTVFYLPSVRFYTRQRE